MLARVRYRQPLAPATLILADNERINAEELPRRFASASRRNPRLSAMLVFEHAQKFVAPGQSAVFYSPADLPAKASASAGVSAKAGRSKSKDFEMLGGGVIL